MKKIRIRKYLYLFLQFKNQKKRIFLRKAVNYLFFKKMNKFLLIALTFIMIINFTLTIKTRQEFVAGASVGSDEVEKRREE